MRYLILFFLVSTFAFGQTTLKRPHRGLDQDYKMCVNDGGVEKCPIDIDGATGLLQGTDGLATVTSPGLVPDLSGDIAFTPTVTFGGIASTNAITSNVSAWGKIGPIVFININFNFQKDAADAGNGLIEVRLPAGLPAPADAVYLAGQISRITNSAIGGGGDSFAWQLDTSKVARPLGYGSNAATFADDGDISLSSGNFHATGFYFTTE